MEPLKITFQVQGGIVSPPYPIHLDGLLAYALTQSRLGPDDPDAPRNIEALREIALDLPLARHEEAGEWVWKASALVPATAVRHTSRFYTQRLDKKDYAIQVGEGRVQLGRYNPTSGQPAGADMAPYQAKIDTLRGAYRNMLGFYPLIEATEFVAWCIGDKEAIADLLFHGGHITHLGARRRAGHGNIAGIKIEADPEAAQMWKQRVRPWKMLDDDAAIQAAWRAPYWAAENRGQAFCPTGLI